MSLPAGARIGAYEVIGPLGAGGMGEVFRARDSRLRRDVALKILPRAALDDPDRRARFDREAQVLAALNHPNVAQVFGVEDAGGTPVIVLELVEGATLAGHIGGRPLPVADALAIALQICDGLEAAHERGIIHRDLKPANIQVRDDGAVKILDFGLARALAEEASVDASHSPTVLGGRTETGIILGTAAYMSPEQARGRAVDKRADIWAFGCVLYEMLTGSPAFPGETTTDILSAVVQQSPDWSRLPAGLPDRIHQLLGRCLEKNAKDRLRDIGDARFEIAEALRTGSLRSSTTVGPPVVAAPPQGGWLRTAAVFLAGAAITGALIGAAALLRPEADTPAALPVRTTIVLPANTTVALGRGSAIALSPDGRQLVFSGRSNNVTRLYLRPLDRFESRPLPGTEDGTNPFFSPDGQWVGFFADRKLKKMPIEGGAPVTVTDAPLPRGEAWGEDESILLTPTNASGLTRVPVTGGKSQPFTTLGDSELSHRWPRVLPGGAAVLFTLWNDTGWEPSRVVAQRIGSSERSVVVPSGGGYARYVRDGTDFRGYLVYARSEGLLAAPFDESRLAIVGQPMPVVDGVVTNLSGGAHFDVAGSGTLAYVSGPSNEAARKLSWLTRDGAATPAAEGREISRLWRLSPDGTRVVRNNTNGPNRDIWIDDMVRQTSARITTSDDNFGAAWSHDGRSVIFARGLPVPNLHRRMADGTGTEERLTTSDKAQSPSSVSPDGKWLAYEEFEPLSGSNIFVLPLPEPGTTAQPSTGAAARPFVTTKAVERNAIFAPDGRWVAYQSNETGRFELYVRSFPAGDQVIQVSTAGGISAVWASSGRELLYRRGDGMIMSTTINQPPAPLLGETRPLFDATRYDFEFALSPDGQRLLMMPLPETENSITEVHLVWNFLDELRQRFR